MIINNLILGITVYCFICSAYYFLLTLLFLVSFKRKEARVIKSKVKKHKYLLLIPAHNEEKVLPRLLDSIELIDYPKHLYNCCVICDNCNDNSENIAKEKNAIVLNRTNKGKKGKGFAIEWALKKIDISKYDVILMTDADTILDKDILNQLDIKFTDQSKQVVQCYNGVINPDDTLLTRLIALARALEIIYMASRSYLGMTVHLIGNGMCFRPSILERFPWTAYSISEDLEYFCILSVNGIRVDYSLSARILLQEENKLVHAQTQRQRWSSGSFELFIRYVPKILWNTFKNHQFKRAEAAVILLVPNPSLLGNIVVVTLMISIVLNTWWYTKLIIISSLLLLTLQFISSFALVKVDKKYLSSLALIPIYLLWKGLIDIKAMIGIKKNQWIKTERH